MANSSMCFAPKLRGFDDTFGRSCHAMPIGPSGEVGSVSSLMLPFFFVANGVSVPISRGRPPGLSIQA